MVRHEVLENGVGAERGLMARQSMEAEPKARGPICWMQMNLIRDIGGIYGQPRSWKCCLCFAVRRSVFGLGM